jgi:hypothetical protein
LVTFDEHFVFIIIRNLGPLALLLRVAKASRPAKEPQIISIWPCECIS